MDDSAVVTEHEHTSTNMLIEVNMAQLLALPALFWNTTTVLNLELFDVMQYL